MLFRISVCHICSFFPCAYVIFQIDQCNNIVLDRFNAKTVCDQLRLDRNIPKTTRQSRRSAKRSKSEPPPERKRRHWLSARVAESLGYVVYEWDKLQEMPHSPSLILDEEYCRLVIYLPGFFSPKLTEVSGISPINFGAI